VSIRVTGETRWKSTCDDLRCRKYRGSSGKSGARAESKEALDKGLRALSTDKMGEAERYLVEAMRLHPGIGRVVRAGCCA